VISELSKLKSQLNKDNSAFKTKIEDIQIKLTSPRLDESTDMRERLWDIEDSLMYLKRMIAEAVLVWNARLAEVTKKRDEKTKKSVSDNSKAPSEVCCNLGIIKVGKSEIYCYRVNSRWNLLNKTSPLKEKRSRRAQPLRKIIWYDLFYIVSIRKVAIMKCPNNITKCEIC
jgi:hypothetical protein